MLYINFRIVIIVHVSCWRFRVYRIRPNTHRRHAKAEQNDVTTNRVHVSVGVVLMLLDIYENETSGVSSGVDV